MAEIAGYQARMRINSQVYKFETANVRDVVNEHSTTNSEGEGYGDSIDTIARADLTVKNASFDPAENGFQAPLSVKKRSVVEVLIYPDGIDDPNPWIFPNLLVLEIDHDFDVNNGQPVTFRGKTKGRYYDPSESP